MEASERALIARSREGDAAAFSALIRRYEDRIYGLARQVCAGLPAEADDVYQETFLTAFKKIRGFRGESGLGTWLFRIASNLCWMRFRKKRREPFVAVLDLPGGEDGRAARIENLKDWSLDPEKAAGKAELRRAVERAMGELPVEHRLVVALRDLQGLSGEETARALGISLAAMKTRLHRGRLFLRQRLDPLMRPGGGR